jgi:hypothetical protein
VLTILPLPIVNTYRGWTVVQPSLQIERGQKGHQPKKKMIQASLEEEVNVTSFEEGWRYIAHLPMTCSLLQKGN